MKDIYLVRHGQASFGSADYDRLSELGVRQCVGLGRWLARLLPEPPAFFSGSQRRHLETGAACCRGWELAADASQVSVEPGLDEFDHEEVLLRANPQFADMAELAAHVGRLDQPATAFQTIFSNAAQRWVSGIHDFEYRESWASFKARCLTALNAVCAASAARQPVVVFSSSGVISAVCQDLLGVPDTRIFDLNWNLVNSGVTRLFWRDSQMRLGYLNNFTHLDTRDESQQLTYR